MHSPCSSKISQQTSYPILIKKNKCNPHVNGENYCSITLSIMIMHSKNERTSQWVKMGKDLTLPMKRKTLKIAFISFHSVFIPKKDSLFLIPTWKRKKTFYDWKLLIEKFFPEKKKWGVRQKEKRIITSARLTKISLLSKIIF